LLKTDKIYIVATNK